MIPDGRHSLNGDGPPEGEAEGEDELASVLDAYLAEVEAGRPVDPEDWVRRHPAIAGRLRACLKGLHLVEAAAEALAITSGPGGAGGVREGPPPGSPPASGSGSEPPGADDDATDPLELGGFHVVRELGRGGMGVVYEAVERALGRRVALKVLPFAAAIDPRQIARFRVEAQAASQLNHPHIVPVYSVGRQGGVHYYAMQLIDGPTLAELIAGLRRQDDDDATEVRPTPTVPVSESVSTPPTTPTPAAATATPSWSLGSTSTRGRAFFREVARLGRQAAEALEHAHQQGVLHRDVKPSNLMVDGRGHVWVTDFGLARFQGEGSLTAPGDLLGTLRYMSPEQASADHAVVDRRTDVYSVGATLYELATLRPVFEGSDRQELLRRIAQEEPRRPRAVQPAVPRDLETIVLKAVAKDPSARYATAQDLADDLGRFLDDRPILARRPGPLERSARWAGRHATALAIVVPLLAATVLALGVAFGLVLAKQAEIERAHLVARQRGDEARRAVDEMYTQVAENWLKGQPRLQPLQRAFLLRALEYYQAFSRERDADPAVRAAAGVAAFRVGEIQRALGNPADAERAYRQAIAVLEAIPRRAAGADVLEWLSMSYGGLGQLLAEADRLPEARPVLDRGVELTRSLASRIPESPAGLPHLAAAYHRLGLLLRLVQRDAEAQAAYRKTIELAAAIGGPRGLKMRAGVHGNLGDLLSLTGQHGEAEQAFRDAVGLYESLVQGDREVPVYRQELARALDRLGVLTAAKPGGLPEAERLLGRALELFDRLAADSPGVPEYRQELASTLLKLADVLATAGRPRDAEPLAARSVMLSEELVTQSPPGSAVVRRQLVRALDRLAELLPATGRPADAEPVLHRAVALREAMAAEGHAEPADRAAMASAHSRLGTLLAARGEFAAARRALEKAAEDQQTATIAATDLARCADLAARDDTLSSEARATAVRAYAGRARDLFRRAAEAGDDPAAPYFLAWFLTACPVAELRDPSEAIRIARGILARAPGSWVAWATLGAAQYRADCPRDAVTALEHAAELNRGDLLHYGFFLAMAHHQLDDPDRARDCFDRTDRRLQGVPRDDEVLRLRAEAAGFLGLANPRSGSTEEPRRP
jgi:serine/threonine protein kinase/tetratricopeptide (TPR) repeat protein